MVAEMIEDYDWESDESEDWESDEAFAESEDSAEDIGEARRRRRQQRSPLLQQRSPLLRSGVKGMALRGPDGRVNNARFPTPLATAAETNRGLAKQELARRALAERLNRLETRSRVQQNKDGSVSGMVTLAIGGGLAGFGLIQARNSTKTGTGIQKWVAEPSTRTAALVSATQLATSGAKVVIKGRYDKSVTAVTADVFAAALLAAFAFGSLHKPEDPPQGAKDKPAAELLKLNAPMGTLIVTENDGFAYRVVPGAGANVRLLIRVS